jgi:two-component system copper resistance phosphate regulon response regulator CusR
MLFFQKIDCMKILLVEDTPDLVSLITRGLSDKGIEVSVAADGNTALEMAFKYNFDLIILDIMLPGINGIQVCREIRKKNMDVAIFMLTALGSTENIVTGLDSGADDYLVKPFKFAELEARIKALIRRKQYLPPQSDTIMIDNLEVNLSAKQVSRNQVPVSLTSTEFRLLVYFAKNQNKVLSRIQILESVWDIDFNMGTNVVDVYINYLRKKIDNGHQEKLIHTIFGMGYMMKTNAPNENSI